MKSVLVLVLLLLALSALLLASSAPPRASAQSTTSLEELRAIVDALFAGDSSMIEELIRFKQVPCVEQPMGLEPLPICPPGVADGTLVDGFPQANCEGRFFPPSEMAATIQYLAEPGAGVVAVYEYTGAVADFLFYGDYIAVAADPAEAPYGARGIYIGDGGIAGFDNGCGADVETFVEGNALGEPIDLNAPLSPALAPTTGGGSSDPSAPVTLAIGLALVSAALVGTGLARRRTGGESGL